MEISFRNVNVNILENFKILYEIFRTKKVEDLKQTNSQFYGKGKREVSNWNQLSESG